jgi:hypothetical protein
MIEMMRKSDDGGVNNERRMNKAKWQSEAEGEKSGRRYRPPASSLVRWLLVPGCASRLPRAVDRAKWTREESVL